MTSKTEQNKVYTLMGASNHTAQDRPPLDMYTTDPTAVEALLQKEKFDANIWEPACGTGNISEVLKTHGYTVYNSDVFDYGYSDMHKQLDFLLSPCSFMLCMVCVGERLHRKAVYRLDLSQIMLYSTLFMRVFLFVSVL